MVVCLVARKVVTLVVSTDQPLVGLMAVMLVENWVDLSADRSVDMRVEQMAVRLVVKTVVEMAEVMVGKKAVLKAYNLAVTTVD